MLSSNLVLCLLDLTVICVTRSPLSIKKLLLVINSPSKAPKEVEQTKEEKKQFH